jgi:hypothetical protein
VENEMNDDDTDNDKLLAKLLFGRKLPILHDPAPVGPDEPSSDPLAAAKNLLVSIQEQQAVKSPELAAKQARLIQILQARRRI